ncbi:MAG: hypothetical protein WAK98_10985, partial [Gemmobacter sp.]
MAFVLAMKGELPYIASQHRRCRVQTDGPPKNASGPCEPAFLFWMQGMTDLIAKTAIDRRLADIISPDIEGLG